MCVGESKKKIIIGGAIIISLIILYLLGLPAFSQTKVAASINNSYLTSIAAHQIINNSGLPPETLSGGVTNEITRSRDAVNAYRYAHEQLYKEGWYRGISEDHTPLLVAMVDVLEKEGYTSEYQVIQNKTPEVLQKFWYASDTQNAKEIGYGSLEEMQNVISSLINTGK